MLIMRSAQTVSAADLTAKATIRDAALGAFAERGFAAVTLREIAADAGTSPALVFHHFGSKAGLRAAVDEHVVALFDRLIEDVIPSDPGALSRLFEGTSDAGLQWFSATIPEESPVLPYLRRMLLEDDAHARALIRHWHGLTVDLLKVMQAGGHADPGPDIPVRAAMLLTLDLALVLLRGALTDTLDFDPLSQDGIERWSADAYRLFAGMLSGVTANSTSKEEP